MVADHEQCSPSPDGRGERGEEPIPGLGRQLHELRRDEVERVVLGWAGEQVDVAPFDTRGDRRMPAVRACATARPRATLEMSVATTCHPRSANQMASAPSPHPTSRARPGSRPSTSATSCGLGFPLQIRGDD